MKLPLNLSAIYYQGQERDESPVRYLQTFGWSKLLSGKSINCAAAAVTNTWRMFGVTLHTSYTTAMKALRGLAPKP